MSSLTPNSSCSLRKQHCKLALKELVSGHVPSPCRFWKWLRQSQSCPGGQSRTYVRVRMQRAESRMSHTLMYDVDTVNTSPVWLQYLMETTLFGCPLREAISWPVTRFHILQLRSVGRRTCPRALEVSPPRARCPGDNTPSEPLPHPQGQRKGASQPQHEDRTGTTPLTANISQPAPTASASSLPLCPSPTFGPSEEQLISGIQAEHRLGVSLCHRDTLQGGCPGILGATHGVNDAPSQERENRYSAGLERHRAHSTGHGRT